MKITAKSWNEYTKKLSQLNQKAGALMREYIGNHGTDDTKAIMDYAMALIQKYGEGSAELACQMYDSMAEMAGVSLPSAEPAEVASYKEVAKMVNATKESPLQMERAVSRMVKRAGADTTLKNAIRDKAEFAWVPHGDTCSFCITLASRGWQRASEDVLKGNHAEHIHSNCDCEYAIRFSENTDVEGYDPDKYLEQYKSAEGKNTQAKINAMRRENYAKNKDSINARKRELYQARKAIDEAGTEKTTGEGSVKARNRGKIGTDELLRYVGKPITEHDNQHVREWYVANVSDIPNQIDLSKPVIDQAKQAYALRTQYKHAARAAMADTETAKLLDEERQALTFEELLDRKMRCKGMTKDDAIKDILETASKTNNNVNKEFGL